MKDIPNEKAWIRYFCLFQVTDRFGKLVQNQLQILYRNGVSSPTSLSPPGRLILFCLYYSTTTKEKKRITYKNIYSLVFSFRKHSIINNRSVCFRIVFALHRYSTKIFNLWTRTIENNTGYNSTSRSNREKKKLV